MSNRGRHKKKTRINRVKIQKLIDKYCNGEMLALDFHTKLKTLLYEQRKT